MSTNPKRMSARLLSPSPQCTHPIMVRLYGGRNIRCCSCGRGGPFGWLYRCVQDRETMIEHDKNLGPASHTFDQLGDKLPLELKARKRGPEAREHRLSFFNEISREQFATYAPDQVALILKQRELLQDTARQDSERRASTLFGRLNGTYIIRDGISDMTRSNPKPWVPAPDQECKYLVCPCCRPSCADRAFLSLNAVANGEIPPAAATGFGFHLLGARPVIDAGVVKNLGCRPVRPPGPFRQPYSSPSSSSTLSFLSLPTDHLPPRNLSLFLQNLEQDEDDFYSLLPTDIISGAAAYYEDETPPAEEDDPQHRLKRSPAVSNLQLSADEYAFEVARNTPLPPATFFDEMCLLGHTSEMMDDEEAERRFFPAPLKVEKGVAVLEESVELGVPDVMTQA